MERLLATLAVVFIGLSANATLLQNAHPGAISKVTTDTCGKGTTGLVNYNYCVYPSADPTNKDIILHFHGLGGNANTWKTAKTYEQVRTHVRNMKRSMPTVVTISMGRLWLLTEVITKNNRYGSVMQTILPFLEGLAGYTGEGRKILIGESMGGFNALQVFFKNPDTFDKVAIICPAVADLSPWATEEEIKAYIRRTGASSIRVAFFMDVAGDEFPTPTDWDMHNPLLFADRLQFSTSSFYLSGDELDEYGFFEGATKLHERLKYKFFDYTWEPMFGARHCEMNTRSIAEFLTSR